MSYNNKKVIVSVIYHCPSSPSQNDDEFDKFLSNLQRLLNNANNLKASLSVVTDVPLVGSMTSILQRG